MHLRTVLREGRFAVTVEVVPPVSADPSLLLARALPLKDLADAVNVTDGPSARVHMGALAAAGLLAANGIEPILQFTCRDRNRIALQADLLGAAALGVRNLLLLRGDAPGAGDEPAAKPVFDFETRDLLAAAAAMRDRGTLASGAPLAGAKPDFFLGAGELPVDPPPGWEPKSLKAKVEAGAEFVQTQFCMDLGVVRRYAAALADAGLTARAPLLIGIAPLGSVRSALFIRKHLYGAVIPDALVARLEAAADPRAEGAAICLELLYALAETPGVAGAHIMPIAHAALVPEVLRRFRR
ncbi:MAG TPA: methylenetetrahydrofolate reductase [Xanthobacteraceae bacterium]|nr:methylenetetrahydrofolate reductase [Xanthobacteraceae bacterium]